MSSHRNRSIGGGGEGPSRSPDRAGPASCRRVCASGIQNVNQENRRMSVIDTLTDIVKIVQKMDNVDLLRRIMRLQSNRTKVQ